MPTFFCAKKKVFIRMKIVRILFGQFKLISYIYTIATPYKEVRGVETEKVARSRPQGLESSLS